MTTGACGVSRAASFGSTGDRRRSPAECKAFVGPRPPGFEGCHNDGDCTNDKLSNLRWDSRLENARDAVRHGSLANLQKTRCPYRHLLVEPNLVAATAARGFRGCRACNSARSARRRARQEGALYDMQYESDLIYDRIMRTRGLDEPNG